MAEDRQDPEASQAWQLRCARMLVEPRGGQIVAEFFDVDKLRSIPPRRRPEAGTLLAQLKNPDRGFDAVVVGEPQWAFYGNQFGNTFELFNHYRVPLWVPEVGGPIDRANEAHELIMLMFGGVSKGERNRIKVRVRTAMAAMAEIEGRYLGGRPPYGYKLINLGPHPNPAKAADGKRLHGLDLDPYAAPVVQRIFQEFLEGKGLFAIAEGLTQDGIPSPSAHDPRRNRHRSGIAWSKSAIRAILTNPRYTGRQVWNRQRKDEALLDVEDITLGHTTKQRWNAHDKWIFSERIVHPQLVDDATFRDVQDLLAGRGSATPHKEPRTCHPYAFKGLMICGICERKMQSQWVNNAPYYRCTFPREYAISNKLDHPRNVYLREDVILPKVDRWLCKAFAPHCIAQAIDTMYADQLDDGHDAKAEVIKAKLAQVEAKMARYRAAVEAGGDLEEISKWITEAKAERLKLEAELRTRTGRRKPSREEITAVISKIGDVAQAVRQAPADLKAPVYQRLGLQLTYLPQKAKVRAEVILSPHIVKECVSEGCHCPLAHARSSYRPRIRWTPSRRDTHVPWVATHPITARWHGPRRLRSALTWAFRQLSSRRFLLPIMKGVCRCVRIPRAWTGLLEPFGLPIEQRLTPTGVGRTPQRRLRPAPRGLTPTGVGRTAAARAVTPRGTAHPHGRGEDVKDGLNGIARFGSPPRAWGGQEGADGPPPRFRLTPTGVGRTGYSGSGISRATAHPHGRGEDAAQWAAWRCRCGSPPRAWGGRQPLPFSPPDHRLTPTGVGRTRGPRWCPWAGAAHPHGRGED